MPDRHSMARVFPSCLCFFLVLPTPVAFPDAPPPVLLPRVTESAVPAPPCWDGQDRPATISAIEALATKGEHPEHHVPCLLPLLFSEDPEEMSAAAAVLDFIVYRVTGTDRSDAVAQALLEAWQALAPPQGLPDSNWRGGPFRVLETARFLYAAAFEHEARRTNQEQAQARLIRWLGLCGNDKAVASLAHWAAVPPLKPDAYLALARIGTDAAQNALAAAAQRGTSQDRALALAAMRQSGMPIPPARLTDQPPGTAQTLAARFRAEAPDAADAVAWGMSGSRAGDVDNLLRQAQALAARGQADRAEPLLSRALRESVSRRQTRAALHQLARVAPEAARSPALSLIQDPALGSTAKAILAEDNAPGADKTLRDAFRTGNVGVRAAVLDVLARRGAEDFAETVQRAADDPSPIIRFMADSLRGAAPDDFDALYTAEQGPVWLRTKALRALLDYFHSRAIAGETEEAAQGFRALADSNAPNWSRAEALEGLGRLKRMDDFDFLQHYRPHPELGRAAATALARVAAAATAPEEAEETLDALRETVPFVQAIEAAAETLAAAGADIRPLALGQGYLVGWRCTGPFHRVMSLPPFLPPRNSAPPETVVSGEDSFGWRALEGTGIPTYNDFGAMLRDEGPATLFCYTEIVLSELTTARAEVTAPGPWRIWVNGESVGEGPGSPEGTRHPPHANLLLNPGINRILLQILRETGPSRYAVRLTDRRGNPIDLHRQRMPDGGAGHVGLGSSAAQRLLESAP